MREIYRSKRHFFPEGGAIMFVIRKCTERVEIEPEMIRLSQTVQTKARKIRKPVNQITQNGLPGQGTE
jgi:hypothetical protein